MTVIHWWQGVHILLKCVVSCPFLFPSVELIGDWFLSGFLLSSSHTASLWENVSRRTFWPPCYGLLKDLYQIPALLVELVLDLSLWDVAGDMLTFSAGWHRGNSRCSVPRPVSLFISTVPFKQCRFCMNKYGGQTQVLDGLLPRFKSHLSQTFQYKITCLPREGGW